MCDPSTSASLIRMILWYRSFEMSNSSLMPVPDDQVHMYGVAAGAELPGGNRSDYQSIRGLTILQLELLGIARDELLAAVASAASEDDVVQWVNAQSDESGYAAINERLSRYTLADNPPERWEFVDTLYPNRPKLPREQVNVFDMLDQDDRDCFAAKPAPMSPSR